MAESLQNRSKSDSVAQIDGLSDGDFSFKALSGLMISSTNSHMPEQRVSVEYLPDHQKLKIPGALGMSWRQTTDNNTKLCETNQTLYSRFWKVASMSYTELSSLVKTTTNAQAIREVIDGLDMMTPVFVRPKLSEPTEAGSSNGDVNVTFLILSKMLQFNCDIRDFGYLLTENATVTDTAWSNNVDNVPRTRLQNKLKPYTLHMIAALNHGSVGNYPLGAWVRAYGLSLGIFPARCSLFKIEAVYTTRMPSMEDQTVIRAYDQTHGDVLMTICGNILACFGLLHLNKNHTYIRGEEDMDRFGMSYIETLRTRASAKMIDDMMVANGKECLLRIAPHPFGLAQTYWLAKVLYKHQLLLPALAVICRDASPPPVQRVMVILRAAGEWVNLPGGRDVTNLFSDKLARLKTLSTAIKAAPPRYSDLHRFYGCEEKIEIISGEMWDDVIALMPVTYGFAMALHVTEDGKNRDGIGLARCLMSVERDMKRVGIMWKNVWRKKMKEMQTRVY